MAVDALDPSLHHQVVGNHMFDHMGPSLYLHKGLFSQLADVMTDVSQLAYQLGVWKRCLSVCVMYVKHISPPSILHRLQPDLDKHDLGRGR